MGQKSEHVPCLQCLLTMHYLHMASAFVTASWQGAGEEVRATSVPRHPIACFMHGPERFSLLDDKSSRDEANMAEADN